MQASALSQFFSEMTVQLAQAPNEVRRLFHGRGQRWEGLE
ncbi:class I SAM-dependent methyltransferase, partial [Vibrio fluvialis]|nr:class I SAM-dependent methyltransferase [Vibrio fluvialis]